MNASSPAPPAVEVSPAQELASAPSSAFEIDRSGRWPILLLFAASLAWLGFGAALGVISSIKLHAAGFLAESPWLTYGRVRPAFHNVLVYGFASQAGLAVALWMLARLGRCVLQGPGLIATAGLFWNVGVAVGLVGILAGDSTGYELLEFPRYASPILFFSYALIGIWAVLTFHARRALELYPSQWYVLAALLWFPWIYSTAQLLLVFGSVRGVLQEIINGWAAHNLFSLWLTPLGLATIFYFLPKLTNRPLHSRSLAIFGFWGLALFGGFGGLPVGTPVPKWMASLSVVGTVLSITAVLAVATNWHLTLAGEYRRGKTDPVFRFIILGAISYLVASILQIAGALRPISRFTEFTLYVPGVTQLYLYGFLGAALSGAIYYIAPRITNSEWPSPGLVTFHFWTTAWGVALVALPLIIGGVVQGMRLNGAEVNFLAVVNTTKPFLGTSTLGGVLLLAGTVAFVINIGWLACSGCCGCCVPRNADRSKAARRQA